MDDQDSHLSYTIPIPCPADLPPHSGVPFEFSGEIPALPLPGQSGLRFPHHPHPYTAGKLPIARWIHEPDEPWSTQTSGAQAGNGQVAISRRVGTHIVPNHVNIHNPQSDSGYGSYPNHLSAAHGSVCDDTQSTLGRSIIDTTQPPLPDSIAENATALGGAWAYPTRSEATFWPCPECGKPIKTKSEQRKHDQRHKKPFKCLIAGCTRKQGFGTENDLIRHKRSVHPEADTPGKRYACSMGSCEHKFKTWPRADNFKSHLQRMHRYGDITESELDSFLYKPFNTINESQDYSQHEIRSEYNYESHNYGLSDSAREQQQAMSFPPPSAHDSIVQSELSSEANWSQTHEVDWSQTHEGDAATQSEADQIAEVPESIAHTVIDSPSPPPSEPEVPASSPPPVTEEATNVSDNQPAEVVETSVDPSLLVDGNELSVRNLLVDSSVNYLKTTNEAASSNNAIEPDVSEQDSLLKSSLGNLKLDDMAEMKKVLEALQNNGLLEQLGYKKEEADNPYRCDGCRKTFRRKCELRKHAKRHEKPFTCSIPGCGKKFGSKNDWKRHENTQHDNASKTCACDARQAADGSKSCGGVGHRRRMTRAGGDPEDAEERASRRTNSDSGHSSRDDLDDGRSKRKRDDGETTDRSKKTKAREGSPLSNVTCVRTLLFSPAYGA
ncbi:hypothetical protein GGR50DRAFT_690571 [Xylaria sp. CBS 124048]|nr:hypothetical protein GGR50DRAFT_690571 [Xylaria sp. CBS 124048]